MMTRREMLIESAAGCLSAVHFPPWRAGRSPLRICLLVEPNLPRHGAPPNLSMLLVGTPGAGVYVRDAAAIATAGIDADIFCNSHGSVYPAGIGEKVYEFLAAGGALLHAGGIPFDRAVIRKDGRWVYDEKASSELREKLGMHRYVPAYPLAEAQGLRQMFDPALVGLPPGEKNLPEASVNITTTLPLHVADPAMFGLYSVTYLSKPVCRHTHIAGQLEDPSGVAILSSLMLTKTWRNPFDAEHAGPCGPWAISTSNFETPMPPEMFARLWAWVSSPAFLGPVNLEMATLRPGEQTVVAAPVHGRLPPGWEASAQTASLTLEEWKQAETPQWRRVEAKVENTQVAAQLHDDGKPDAFLFCVRFQLTDDSGKARDYSDSAVAAWRPEALESGPRLRRNRSYLDYSMPGCDRPASFQLGTNWQDSEVYLLTWHNPNPLRVARDARSLAEAGLRVMRVHYVMPEFLKVLAADVFRRTHADFYHSFEAGPELTERHLRALEAHAMVFGRLGIIFMPTVYTNVGPSMGNAQKWMNTSERFEIPDMIGAQKMFARQVMDRLGRLPCISWDLVNEPDVAMPTVGRWFDGMRPIWARPNQLAGIGTFGLARNLSLGESADWHSAHTDCTHGIAEQIFRTGKPNFYHEAYVPTEATAAGEIEVERTLGQTIARTVVRGGCGFIPWNWNRLLAYWKYGASTTEAWDLNLGACAQGEGVRRTGWYALRNWARLLDGVSFDQALAAQIIHLYPRFTITGDRPQLWLDSIRGLNLACTGINDREFAEADLSGARLVIVPHYGMGYRESTYRKLLEFAARGGVVWAHADSLRRDEAGKLDARRTVRFAAGRVRAGKGAIEWYFGWSVPPLTVVKFEQLLRGLKLARPPEGTMPLAGGELRFTGDKDLVSIRTVQIVNGAGTVTRAWSGYGDPLAWPGISISSPGQLFVTRIDSHTFRVSGEQVRIASSAPVSARLPAFPHYELARSLEHGQPVIEPRGWQRGHWFELRSP